MINLIFCSVILFISSCAEESISDDPPFSPTPFELVFPETFPEMEIPVDNQLTEEGILLGRRLYYDHLLHGEGLFSCASCHVQEKSFSSDPNVLPHINLGWSSSFLWNGKISGSLEDIMHFEVTEFFNTDLEVLRNHPHYPQLYFSAFGTREVSYENTAMALSQFLRTVNSFNSRFDDVIENKEGFFFTDSELNGFDIFFTEKGDCFHCHGGILFTDNQMHNNGLDAQVASGYFEISGNPSDLGKFKTPTLRNVELTGPYMHDGRYRTLVEVIDFYSQGLQFSQTIDPLMKNVHRGGIQLTETEKTDLIAFLKTLTDTSFLTNIDLASPF